MEQKNISFNKGIHRTPSIGDSGELSECVNLIPRFGELQNIEPPKKYKQILNGYKLRYVHSRSGANSYDNLIFSIADEELRYIKSYDAGTDKTQTQIQASSVNFNLPTGIIINDVTSVGNTLCVATNDGIYYFLWKNGCYTALGNKIPEINLSFGLCGTYVLASSSSNTYEKMVSQGSVTENYDKISNAPNKTTIGRNLISDISNQAYSALNTLENHIAEEHGFSYPFFIRYAIKLFDGNIVNQTSPVLMIPNDDGLPVVTLSTTTENGNDKYVDVHATAYLTNAKVTCKKISTESDLSPWEDIISSVEIYMSPQIQRYKEDGEVGNTVTVYASQDNETVVSNSHYGTCFKGIKALMGCDKYPDFYAVGYQSVSPTVEPEMKCSINGFPYSGSSDYSARVGELKLPVFDEAEWADNLKNVNSYFKASELSFSELISTKYDNRVYLPLKESVVSNIQVQKSFAEDTNYSHYRTAPSRLVEYNSRLIAFDSERIISGPMEPLTYLSYCSGTKNVTVYVELDYSGIICVKKFAGGKVGINNIYFVSYPDEHAKKMAFFDSDGTGVELELLPLNGVMASFWFDGMKKAVNSEVSLQEWETKVSSSSLKINLSDRIFISEADNPFLFKGSSALTLPTRVIDLSTSAKALSQGQFGQFPLYAFCEDGIWAVSVSSEGKLESKQPVNRDVLLNDNCVCLLDDSVAYLTKEGMKIISGSQAECISIPLHGLNVDDTTGSSILSAAPEDYEGLIIPDKNAFHSHISEGNCMMLYDYPHRLIHLFTGTLNTSHNAHFVYSRDSQEWSMQKLHASYNNASTITAKTVVPGYPLSYLQSGYDLYQYDHLNDVSNIRKGYFLTRPEALSNPFSRKCLYDLRLFGQKTLNSSKWKVVVLVSNDLQHWAKLTSLKGLSAKYYRFMVFTEFTDVDTLSGMALQYEERYGNKLR